MQLSALPSRLRRLRRSLSILPNITRPGKFGASFGAATTLTRRRSKRSWPVSLVFAKRRAAGGVRLIEGLRRAGIERPIVSLELERVMPALRADRLGHFRVAMQRVAGDDTAFQIKAFQRFQRRFDLIAVVARPRAEGKTRLSVPHADHQRRHEGAATLIAAPQPFAVDGDDARRLTKPQAFAQRFGEGHEGAGHLVRVEQAKQARETVVARRPMRQIDDLGKARLIGAAEIGNVDATLRPAQSRHQGNEQHRRAIMPRVNVTRIAYLAKDGNKRFHRSPSNQEAFSRIAFYLARNTRIVICDSPGVIARGSLLAMMMWAAPPKRHQVPKVVAGAPQTGRPSMDKFIRIGVDLGKNYFQLHAVGTDGAPAMNRKLSRSKTRAFFARMAPCRIGMEACGSAHYWARELGTMGHDVVLMPPAY